MKLATALITLCLLAGSVLAQTAPTSVTVPITLDHNRIIIDVRFPLPDGSSKRVRAWLDNGNPDMWITGALAQKLGLEVSGEVKDTPFGKERTVPVPGVLQVGGMALHATGLERAQVVLDRDSIGPGTSAEINLPSTVLRNYDVLVDYLNRELTIAVPGTLHFKGTAAKASLNPDNALIQLPAKIAGGDVNLALDVGAPFGLVSQDLLGKLRQAHPQWPHMTGGVGPANLWGLPEEAHWELLRIPTLQYGGIPFTDVGVASFPKEIMSWFEKRAGMPTAGLIGANALLNYRVGIDYAHGTVYFEQISKRHAPEMDVVGLTLRPEPDGNYSVIGVADFGGKPSVAEVKAGDVLVAIDKVPAKGGTMGQVWSLLSGSPGEVRTLTLDRAGKQFTVKATVYRFLSAEAKKRAKPKSAKMNQR
ncbi:MAG: hypothetical protein LAN63_00580 [Acidobacteriia bacterium]|nr:hypothetical protein [Terriglobia bacterium]